MKKIICSLFVFLCLLTGLTVNASETSDYAVDLLKNLDILEEAYTPSNDMTRSEFAEIIARIFKNDNSDYSKELYFSDVKASSVGKTVANDINKAAAYGILKGFPDNTFRPNDNVTKDDVAAALVRMLGYEEVANLYGEYPSGAGRMADRLGLYKGISAGDNLGEQIVIMIKNSLEADVMEYLNSKYEIENGKTLFNSILNTYKYSGQLKAVGQTALSSDSAVGDGSAVVGEEKLVVDEAYKEKLRDVLGLTIEIYYEEDSYGDKKLLSFRIKDDADITEIEIDAETQITQGQITYTDENGRKRTKKITSAPYIVYNNRPLNRIPSLGTAGSIRLIGEDIIIIKDYQTYAVQSISLQNSKIMSKYSGNVLDLSDAEEVSIRSLDGQKMKLEDIKAGNVISVLCSDDNECFEITVCTKSFYGRIDGINGGDFYDYKLEISAYEYGVTEELYNELRFEGTEKLLSVTGDFYVDIFGRVAYFEYGSSPKRSVGYMVRAWNNFDLDTVQIKIFNTSGKFEILTLSEKLSINDVKVEEPQAFVNMYQDCQLISYVMNNDGEVSKIYTAVDLSDNSKVTAEGLYRINSTPFSGLIYRSNQKSFNSSVIANDSLVSFVIPGSAADMSNENYYMIESLNSFSSGTEYNNITFYKFDPESLRADVIVRTRDFTGFVNDVAPLLFDKFITTLSNDDEVVDQLCAYNDAGSVTYLSRSDSSLRTVQNGTETIKIGKGDIIRCAVNPLDEVGRLELVYSYENDKYYGQSNPVIKDTQVYRYGLGTVVKRDGNIIKVQYRGGTVEYFDISNSKMLVVTGEPGDVSIEEGDMSDIITAEQSGTPSTLFIYSPRNEPSLIYIYN